MNEYFQYLYYCCLAFLLTSAFVIVGCTSCLSSEGNPTTAQLKSSSSKRQIEYIFMEHRCATVGGRPTEKETFYLHIDGTVIVSKESSNGILADLKTGFSDPELFFEDLSDGLSMYSQNVSKNDEIKKPLEVSEYYPPSTMVQYCYSGDQAPTIIEQTDKRMSASFSHLVKTFRAFIDGHAKVQSSPTGIYGRITSVSHPDKKFVSIDIKQDQLTNASCKLIQRLTQRPLALAYLSDNSEDILLGGDKYVSIKKPVYLDFNGTIFILKAFLFPNNSN